MDVPITLSLVSTLAVVAGLIIVAWRKLGPFARAERARVGRESMWEWFQWLAERLMQHETETPRIAAQLEYRDWQP